jgi:hypothetical protein
MATFLPVIVRAHARETAKPGQGAGTQGLFLVPLPPACPHRIEPDITEHDGPAMTNFLI